MTTKEQFIEIAHQLFSRIGVEKTTMNDIATAANKGRRTLYTYFKNKQEIYKGVVEREFNTILSKMERIVKCDVSPNEKLLNFINERMASIKEMVACKGTLKFDFFRDVWKMEILRKPFDNKEIGFLKNILNEGVSKGIFEVLNVEASAYFIHYALRGLDVSYSQGDFNRCVEGDGTLSGDLGTMLLNGIIKKKE